MTKEQLQRAKYEAYATQLLNRIEAQEAEIAKLGTMAEQTRADAVTRAAADEKRIAALRHECERWKAAYSDRCALLDVIHASLGIDKDDNVIGEIDRIHKARNGLQAQVQDLRAALAKEQELHAATALRLSTEAAKMVELTWKIGDWVKAPLGTRGEIVEIGNEYICVNIPGEQHPMRWWPKHMCTLCDPPAETTEATHDTPEGKDLAESVIRDSRSRDINDGDLVEVVSHTGLNTWPADVGSVGTVVTVEEINDSISVHLEHVPGKKNALAGYVSFCDVRKVTT